MLTKKTLDRLEELEENATPASWTLVKRPSWTVNNMELTCELRNHAKELIQAARENVELKKEIGSLKNF